MTELFPLPNILYFRLNIPQFSSVQFSHSVVSDSLRLHGPQHARSPCPSPTPRVCSDSCPLNQWCHPTISSSVAPFSSCLQSFPASGSFQMSQLFTSDGQSIGVSASTSVLPMNTQDWSPLEWTVVSRHFSHKFYLKHLKISKTRAWTTRTRHKPSGRIGVWEGRAAQALISHLVIGSLRKSTIAWWS